MINRIVTGYPAKKYKAVHEMPDSSLRDLLTPIQKQAMLSLQKANTVYLEEGLSFDERKERLNTLFNRRWNAKLIEECHLMCEWMFLKIVTGDFDDVSLLCILISC